MFGYVGECSDRKHINSAILTPDLFCSGTITNDNGLGRSSNFTRRAQDFIFQRNLKRKWDAEKDNGEQYLHKDDQPLLLKEFKKIKTTRIDTGPPLIEMTKIDMGRIKDDSNN